MYRHIRAKPTQNVWLFWILHKKWKKKWLTHLSVQICVWKFFWCCIVIEKNYTLEWNPMHTYKSGKKEKNTFVIEYSFCAEIRPIIVSDFCSVNTFRIKLGNSIVPEHQLQYMWTIVGKFTHSILICWLTTELSPRSTKAQHGTKWKIPFKTKSKKNSFKKRKNIF